MARKQHIAIAAIVIWAFCAGALSAGSARLTFDHFYDGPAVTEALNTLHEAYPSLTDLRSIGKSEEGRDIWLLTINNPATGAESDKPGICVDGAIHGNEIQATEVCLYLASYVLDAYDSIPAITKLVDSRVFYIIPVINVDNRWRFFANPSGYDYGRSAVVPYDDDRDGLYDEDGVEDLDGDGEILEMRIRDPFGDFKSDPDDPRVMIRVKPGEKGEWRLLDAEGIDNDGDGRLNEDGPGYLDMNRNFGFKWQPPYVQGGAGEFPMSAKVIKAVSDFFLTKPNICIDFSFHNSGGLIVRGPGSKAIASYPPQDVAVYDFLGKDGEKIIPGYKYVVSSKDMYTVYGDLSEYVYSGLGIFGFVGELFTSSQERYRKPDEKPGSAETEEGFRYYGGTPPKEKQKFNDAVTQGIMFREWKSFSHPHIGPVEIGGWRTFTTRIPQPFQLPEMVHRNASLVLFAARHAPDVSLEVLEVKDLGGDMRRIRVRAANRNAIPTLSSRATGKNLVRKDILKIEGNGIEVVSGGIVSDAVMDRIEPIEHRPWMVFTSVPSFGKTDVQWIVKGKGKVTITYDALRARDQTLTIDL